uniref:RING-type domain-containing protein n=1 Tax=Acrobeloides nanus TaxID=290746 RepID=A0A914DYR6_9BILA
MSLNLVNLAQKNDENVSCGICWLPYTSEKRAPITLRCGHTICRMCIEHLSKGLKHVPCGICREKTFVEPKKLMKNYELIRILSHFRHLQKDAVEPEEKTMTVGQFETTAAHYVRLRANTNQQDNYLEQIDRIVHNMHEALEAIRNHGDILQVYAIENQGDLARIRRRIEPVFSELRQLLVHPLRKEMSNLFRRLEAEHRPDSRLVHSIIAELYAERLNEQNPWLAAGPPGARTNMPRTSRVPGMGYSIVGVNSVSTTATSIPNNSSSTGNTGKNSRVKKTL